MTGVLHQSDRLPEVAAPQPRDFTLLDYPLAADPAGRLQSASVLRHLLRRAGFLDRCWPAVTAFVDSYGAGQTVWKVRLDRGGDWSFELYLFRYTERERKTVTAVRELLAPLLVVDSRIDEALPYEIVSVELDGLALATGTARSHVYFPTGPGAAQRRLGFSYLVEGDRLVLENHYHYFKPDQLAEVRDYLHYSVHAGDAASQEALTPPELFRESHRVCVTTKHQSTCLYFSRLTSAALVDFLVAFESGPLHEVFAAHGDDFAHLRWDIGYDFAPSEPGSRRALVSKIHLFGFI